jgi:hypothetical protein
MLKLFKFAGPAALLYIFWDKIGQYMGPDSVSAVKNVNAGIHGVKPLLFTMVAWGLPIFGGVMMRRGVLGIETASKTTAGITVAGKDRTNPAMVRPAWAVATGGLSLVGGGWMLVQWFLSGNQPLV